MEPSWSPAGAQLEQSWSLAGTKLEPSWSLAGAYLESSWSLAGAQLEPSWSIVGAQLEPGWSQAGANLEPSWSLAEAQLEPSWSLPEQFTLRVGSSRSLQVNKFDQHICYYYMELIAATNIFMIQAPGVSVPDEPFLPILVFLGKVNQCSNYSRFGVLQANIRLG